MPPKQLQTSRLLDVTKCLLKSKLGEEEREEKRRGEEQACYVTPLSVLCLSQYSDVSFLTTLVSNLASLLFLATERLLDSKCGFFMYIYKTYIFFDHCTLLQYVRPTKDGHTVISRIPVQFNGTI